MTLHVLRWIAAAAAATGSETISASLPSLENQPIMNQHLILTAYHEYLQQLGAAGAERLRALSARPFQHRAQPCHGFLDWLAGRYGDYYRQLDGDDTRLPPLFGWDAGPNGCDPVPCLRAIDEGPAAFVVEGAGYAPCNGQYAREGTHDGSPLYRMGQYVLVRARTNRYNWFIGDKDKLEENAGDLYSSACCLDYPSATGWRVDEDGREPAPRIYAVDAAGQKLEYGWHVPAAAPLAVLQAQVIAPGGAAF